jgi:hypothetical protein
LLFGVFGFARARFLGVTDGIAAGTSAFSRVLAVGEGEPSFLFKELPPLGLGGELSHGARRSYNGLRITDFRGLGIPGFPCMKSLPCSSFFVEHFSHICHPQPGHRFIFSLFFNR